MKIREYLKVLILLVLFCGINLLAKSEGDFIVYIWSGGVSDTKATIVAKTKEKNIDTVCIISPNKDLSNPAYISPTIKSDNYNIVRFNNISQLNSNTQYYYGIKVNGKLEVKLNSKNNGSGIYTGKFKTFPSSGKPASFKFTSSTGHHGSTKASTHPIYTKTKEENGLFHIITGDFYYCDQNHHPGGKNKNLSEDFVRLNYEYPLTSENQSDLYRSTPIIYVWDDHDFGRDNRVGAEEPVAMPNVHSVYRQLTPHYPLKGGDMTPIFQTFSVGRVRFILTDLYTASSKVRTHDTKLKTRLGAEQKKWFKEELLKANGSNASIIWISSLPWNGKKEAKKARWQSYATERTEIANFIKDNNIQGLSIISGDMHGSAIDDGRNADFATGGGAPIPVFQTGPYGRPGSCKGGPYNYGSTTKGKSRFYYGLIEVIDDGNSIKTNWTVKNKDGIQESLKFGSALKDNKEIKYSFTYSNPIITNLFPKDNSKNIQTSGKLEIEFSKNIFKDKGNIYIHKVLDNSILATIPISKCSINKNKLIIPYSKLKNLTEYYIAIDKSIINDNKGNYFSGIYNPNNFSYKKWNFKTK